MKKNEEKIEGGEIAVSGGFLGWLDNFWYHYKWPTIGIALLIIVFTVCTLQMCTSDEDDVVLHYAGDVQLSVGEIENICGVFEAVCPEDYNNDGTKNIGLMTHRVLLEDKIVALEKETDSEGHKVNSIDRTFNTQQYNDFYDYIQTGESSILLISPELYRELRSVDSDRDGKADRIVRLGALLGYIPEEAVDEYAVRLGDTEIYKSYSAIRALPEDTLICLLEPNWKGGKNSKEKYYNREKQIFTAILEYSSDTKEDTAQ
ncbi:MAG: hypothetical protein E7577_03145 [Ruminococcaceae bacterium]|nr:hypothetical protein [Oscillospiraceae bacterium]